MSPTSDDPRDVRNRPKFRRVEEVFDGAKAVGGLRRTRFRGIARTQQAAFFVGAADNLLRIR